MMTMEVKDILIKILQELVADHQKKRAAITTEQVLEFMKIRPIKVDIPPVLVVDPEPEKKKEEKHQEGKKKGKGQKEESGKQEHQKEDKEKVDK